MRKGLVAVALLAAAPAVAEVVELRSGGRLTGVVVQQTPQAVVVETGPGRVSIPMSQVVRVVAGRSPLQQWRERAAALSPRDAQDWASLARWAEDAGLGTQAREAWERVLAVDPGSVEANEALRRVQVNGRWLPEEEAYRARGYVHFEGRWMSPAEHEARVRELAQDEADQQQRREEAMRLREAAARAREAEARARGAEMANSDQGGMPYGDGIYGGYPYIDPYGAYGYGSYPYVSPYGALRFRGQRGFGAGHGLPAMRPGSINARPPRGGMQPTTPTPARAPGALVVGARNPVPAAPAQIGAIGASRH